MSGNFFDRLELELGSSTREGAHLEPSAARSRARIAMLLRRATVIVVLAIALAASLASEFPASASGSAPAAQISAVRGL